MFVSKIEKAIVLFFFKIHAVFFVSYNFSLKNDRVVNANWIVYRKYI